MSPDRSLHSSPYSFGPIKLTEVSLISLLIGFSLVFIAAQFLNFTFRAASLWASLLHFVLGISILLKGAQFCGFRVKHIK